MPLLYTNITNNNNNNKTSSVLSKLNLDLFTISTNNNASSNSTASLLNLSTLPYKKWTPTTTST